MIEAAAGRTEKERKIPADVLSAMHASGLFHMLLPVSIGGAAVDLVTFHQEKGLDGPGHARTLFRWDQRQKPAWSLTLSRFVAKCQAHSRTRPASPIFPGLVTPVTRKAILS